jgi:hypothetical protein
MQARSCRGPAVAVRWPSPGLPRQTRDRQETGTGPDGRYRRVRSGRNGRCIRNLEATRRSSERHGAAWPKISGGASYSRDRRCQTRNRATRRSRRGMRCCSCAQFASQSIDVRPRARDGRLSGPATGRHRRTIEQKSGRTATESRGAGALAQEVRPRPTAGKRRRDPPRGLLRAAITRAMMA